ncbi:hypothetical protein [Streptomyces sp. 891-h]|uniref:hypothetical protein n=1 Tax=Streptomyces sp. 891-h TaxID=2720714 RepID=UPI001FA9CC55|nr:hypothetical protein [Streptomyces sp. 891-h]UNZ20594.1 hypothetical protein HC362_29560 [Streptomyces sp. 891-h]
MTDHPNTPVPGLIWLQDGATGAPATPCPPDTENEPQTGAQNPDCPACDAGLDHDEHCPTPETHNWGCGCPTDQAPAARRRERYAEALSDEWRFDPHVLDDLAAAAIRVAVAEQAELRAERDRAREVAVRLENEFAAHAAWCRAEADREDQAATRSRTPEAAAAHDGIAAGLRIAAHHAGGQP